MGAHDTKTFMSGNSVAVRLPKGLGIGPDISVSIEREGDAVVIRPLKGESQEEVRRSLEGLIQELRAVGRAGEAERRVADIFPERAGLY